MSAKQLAALYQLLPYERQGELFEDLFRHRLSVASLMKAEQVCDPLRLHRSPLDVGY